MASRQGIETHHKDSCSTRRGGQRCTCSPSFRAYVWDQDLGKLRRSQRFARRSDAVAWRTEMLRLKQQHRLGPESSPTLEELAEEVFDAIEAGTIANRNGKLFKPSTLRTYRTHYESTIKPRFADSKVSEITRRQIQRLIDELARENASSTVKNKLMPLRFLLGYAAKRDLIASNPIIGVVSPPSRESITKILPLEDGEALLERLEGRDQAIFATAIYSGLRLGELRALKWRNVDLENKVIRVVENWDREEGPISPKSNAGLRVVPLIPQLERILLDLDNHDPDNFVLGAVSKPFGPQSLYRRTDLALEDVGLDGVRLHPLRHTYASLMISAGVGPKTLSVIMGHSTITITMDRYSHLFAGEEQRAGSLLEKFLEKNKSKTAQ